MVKTQERKLAQLLFIEQGKTAKEIAAQLGVNEHTVGDWVNKGNWKVLRAAHVNAPHRLVANIQEVINTLTERRLELEKRDGLSDEEKAAVAQEKVTIADEVSKWNKALENARDESMVSLGVYINVCEDVFKQLYLRFPKLTSELAEFNRQHIEGVARRYV